MADQSDEARAREQDQRDLYFMSRALLARERSKDPHFQVGSVIVSPETGGDYKDQVIGVGYNGFPIGCSDNIYSWGKEEKNMFVCHAEVNAIAFALADKPVQNSTMYVTCHPCNTCAQMIIQNQIKEVVYLSDCKLFKEEFYWAERMLEHANIPTRHLRRQEKFSIKLQ